MTRSEGGRMRGGVALVLLGLGGAATEAAAQSDQAAEPPARPVYRTLHFEEDWSVLANPEALPSHDFFDPIKYIRLDDRGFAWLSLGGQARGRGEVWGGFNFGGKPGSGDPDDEFGLFRLMTSADLHVAWARAFLELKSALATDVDLPGGSTTQQVDRLAIQNGFLEFAPPLPGGSDRRLVVRFGRQELLFGAQRLVSPSDWTNTRRTFDGATVSLELWRWRVTGLWMRPVQVRQKDWNVHVDASAFYGIYATGKIPGTDLGLDLYWLGNERGRRTFGGTSGDEERQTFGGRTWGPIGATGIDFELEGAAQTGNLGPGSISAGMVSTELGWWLTDWRFAPRFHLNGDWASGDHRPGGVSGTFDPLFPFGHRYFGEIDVQGRSNVVAVSSGVELRPLPGTTAAISVYHFWRAERGDALYNAAEQVLRAGSRGRSRDVGTELDLVVGWQFDPHTLLEAGYAHYFPAEFITESGRDQSINFGYVSVQYTF
jgi:hypothetical protein